MMFLNAYPPIHHSINIVFPLIHASTLNSKCKPSLPLSSLISISIPIPAIESQPQQQQMMPTTDNSLVTSPSFPCKRKRGKETHKKYFCTQTHECSLGLRNLDTLANHQTSMKNEHGHHRVEFERRALEPQAHGNLVHSPALVDPVRHDLHYAKTHRNRCALEILALSGCILGHHGDGDIESGEAREAAEDEEGEQEVVDGGAHAEAESGGGWGHAKGDEIGK